jgi:hypothetical protein
VPNVDRHTHTRRNRSGLETTVPGRVDKSQVLHALQASGESYDVVRETLKHVSVDASGKVELEDWVEVRLFLRDPSRRYAYQRWTVAQCQAAYGKAVIYDEEGGRQGHCTGCQCQYQPYPQRR